MPNFTRKNTFLSPSLIIYFPIVITHVNGMRPYCASHTIICIKHCLFAMKHMWPYKIFTLVSLCMLFLFVMSVAAAPLSADGEEYVAMWGSFTSDDRNESAHSYGIAMDAAGNVYVNDPERGRIRSYLSEELPLAVQVMPSKDYPVDKTRTMQITSMRSNEWTVGAGDDDNFATIQDAVNAAANGDTILIQSGTYKEDIVVNKSLILDGNNNAAIDGSITLTADGTTLLGCMVVSGVWVRSDNNVINGVLAGWHVGEGGDWPWGYGGFNVDGSYNTFTNCLVDGYELGPGATGMVIKGTTGNTFIQSSVIDSYIGTRLTDSTDTTLLKCHYVARANTLIIDECTNIKCIDCSMIVTDYIDTAVELGGSESTFINCNIIGGGCGVFGGLSSSFTDCCILGGTSGVCDGSENTFEDCTIFGKEYGIFLDVSRNNDFTGCIISSESCGVYQGKFSKDNAFTRCTVHGDSADWCGFAFFNDAALDNAVREEFGVFDQAISAEEMTKLTVIRASDLGIDSLAGLEYATNLRELSLDNNSICDLWPLAGLTGLRELDVSYNEISDISPLITNSHDGGHGLGDRIDLRYNRISLTQGSAAMKAIETLAAQGILVLYEPQEPIPVISANFTSDVIKGIAPLKVAFTDCSIGVPDEWFWEFGDGMTSTEQHTVHTYTSTGTYTVCLTVTNGDESDSVVYENHICVHPPSTPVNEFPVIGSMMMVMICGIFGIVSTFIRKNSPK